MSHPMRHTILRCLALCRMLSTNWYAAGASRGKAAEPIFAQSSAARASVARSRKTHASCHAAAATDTLNIAMLVREKRVTSISDANTITTAAVAAAGIANGENWYAGMFVWTEPYSVQQKHEEHRFLCALQCFGLRLGTSARC